MKKALEKAKKIWHEENMTGILGYIISLCIIGSVLLFFKAAGSEHGNMIFGILFGFSAGVLLRTFLRKKVERE